MRKMFSKEQIKKLIEEALLSGKFNDELKQVIPALNEELDIAEDVTFSFGSLTDLEFTKSYMKIRKTADNDLFIVLNFSIKNNAETSQNLANWVQLQIRNIPESISSKIYDCLDVPLNQQNEVCGIFGGLFYHDSAVLNSGFSGYHGASGVRGSATLTNGFNIVLRDAGNLASGATRHYSFRVFLTL